MPEKHLKFTESYPRLLHLCGLGSDDYQRYQFSIMVATKALELTAIAVNFDIQIPEDERIKMSLPSRPCVITTADPKLFGNHPDAMQLFGDLDPSKERLIFTLAKGKCYVDCPSVRELLEAANSGQLDSTVAMKLIPEGLKINPKTHRSSSENRSFGDYENRPLMNNSRTTNNR